MTTTTPEFLNDLENQLNSVPLTFTTVFSRQVLAQLISDSRMARQLKEAGDEVARQLGITKHSATELTFEKSQNALLKWQTLTSPITNIPDEKTNP